MPSFNLGTLTNRQGATGQRISFTDDRIGFGFALAGGLDTGTDGIPDIVVSAYSPTSRGAVYSIGGATNQGAIISSFGNSGTDTFGYSVAMGNFNGGRGDILIGSPGSAVGPTSVNGGIIGGYLDQNATTLNVSFDNYNPNGGNPLASSPTGNIGDNWGAVIENVGDLNGDALDDFFIAAPGNDGTAGTGSDVGFGYILYGRTTASYFGQRTEFSTLVGGANGFSISTPAIAEDMGFTAAAGGNVNGAGGVDLILGDSSRNVVVVNFASNVAAGGSLSLSGLNGVNGVNFFSSEAGALFGASVTSSDINRDGLADIIVGAPGAAGGAGRVYVIFGAASFSTGSIDVNAPGGSGATIVSILGTGQFGHDVASIGDFNGDGANDIVIGAPQAGSFGNGYVLFGASGLASASAIQLGGSQILELTGESMGTGWAVSRAGDMNGDQIADLLISAYSPTTTRNPIYVVYGNRSFGPTASINDVRNDFNGDGRSDILWRNANGDVTNWLGQANGSFVGNAGNSYNNPGAGWTVAGTADFNGDGRHDILWRNSAGDVTSWLGQTNGNFAGSGAFNNPGAGWSVVGTDDFNGDGRDDILWRNSGGIVTNWLGQANGNFAGNAANSYNNPGAGWSVAGTGDFNGDGRDDILWRNGNGDVTSWLGQANGNFAGSAAFNNPGAGWSVAGTGDFNGDGRDDILWRDTSGNVTNWLGQANGNFIGNAANSFNNPGAGWSVIGVGDYNGDGRDDILWRNTNGDVTNWLGQANGNFAGNASASYNPLDNGWHVQPDPLL